MYWVIWRYKIKESEADAFESAYGPMGSWANFFRKADTYQGSRLLKNSDVTGEYMLIDQWDNRKAYEDFLDMERISYQQMSMNFEKLYVSEERIGTFLMTK